MYSAVQYHKKRNKRPKICENKETEFNNTRSTRPCDERREAHNIIGQKEKWRENDKPRSPYPRPQGHPNLKNKEIVTDNRKIVRPKNLEKRENADQEESNHRCRFSLAQATC